MGVMHPIDQLAQPMPAKQHSNLCVVLTIIGVCFLFASAAFICFLLFYKKPTRPRHEITKPLHREPLAAKQRIRQPSPAGAPPPWTPPKPTVVAEENSAETQFTHKPTKTKSGW